MNEIMAMVNKVKLINHNVYEIGLTAQAGSFLAGQYLLIPLPTGETVPYSIGSAPHELPELTLYILVTAVDSLAGQVVRHLENHLQSKKQIKLVMPSGDCHTKSADINTKIEKILLIAAGTGIAQMKSMYSSLMLQKPEAQVLLYWGLNTEADIFLRSWCDSDENITLVVNNPNQGWQGASGWLYEKILADHNFHNTLVFVSGSPAMVYGTLDKLEAAGLASDASYSDVFAYAPRVK